MTDSTTFKLNEIDSEDIGDVLMKIQKTFNLKFGYTDFKDCKTYGDLCDVISSHLNSYKHLNDCTSQQVFYKIRETIITINMQSQHSKISPNTSLEILFPKSCRRKEIKLLKQKLELKIEILSMQLWLSRIFTICITCSVILLFLNWKFGLIGFLFFTISHLVASQFNNEFEFKTIGELAKRLITKNYFQFRRIPNTLNKYEVEKIIDNIFIKDLGVDKTELYKEASLGWG